MSAAHAARAGCPAIPAAAAAAADPLMALQALQRRSFDYFVAEADGRTGLVRDKTAPGAPASIAATGLALTAWALGEKRGWISRDQSLAAATLALRFLAGSDQSGRGDATGHRGFYFHFLDPATGRRARKSELSSIDTALALAGILFAAQHFDRDVPGERELRALACELYERVDWRWMLDGGDAICHGWRPGRGFMPYHWRGYNEALLLYLLALGSPTHPVAARSWAAWTSGYRWRKVYGIEHLAGGPLFVHQLPHLWVDFRGIADAFMRERGIDYFENSRRATLLQQRYAIRNPRRFPHYGEHFWGLSASDGPGPARRRVDGRDRRFFDYTARGVPHGPDDGTIAPWAVVASLPFAPEIVMPTIAALDGWCTGTASPYGFKSALNPSFATPERPELGWVSPWHFAIDEGPMAIMIENHLSGYVWSRMRSCPPIVAGLRAAGFEGGWLDG